MQMQPGSGRMMPRRARIRPQVGTGPDLSPIGKEVGCGHRRSCVAPKITVVVMPVPAELPPGDRVLPFRNARLGAVGVILSLALVLCVVGTSTIVPSSAAMAASADPLPRGGPFRLSTHEGKLLSDLDLRGKPFALFFGFTHCPEVCPTTLFEISELLKDLGPDADKLKVVFVTLDPDRDTPELLATYLQSFDPRIVALTGSEVEIDAIAEAYWTVYNKVWFKDGAYSIEHTATVSLMDARGRYAADLGYAEPHESKLAKLRRLVDGMPPSPSQ
jgi:protein SCO1